MMMIIDVKGLLAFGSCFPLFVAACVISTIASSENTLAVVKHGAVPNLLKLLHSTVDTNREKAVEALGEIARGDSPDCRETLLSSGAFEALLPHLSEDAESSMVKIAIRALPKFWSAKPILSFCQTELVVDVIQRLIGSSDDELVSEACWALFHITHESKDNLGGNNVNGMCICHMLVKLLGHRNQSVLYPALQAAIVLTAGDEFHIQAVVASGAISALVNLLQTPEFDTKKKAAWAITNVTYEASKDRIKFLVDEGCIIPLCNLLDSRDQESLKVCLQGLEIILKAGEYKKNLGSSGDDNVYAHKIKEAAGVRMMRKLLNGDGDEIHQMAARILEEYFLKKKKIMSSVD